MLEEENKGEILEKEENIENENSEENTTNESSVKAELEETTDRLKRLMAEFDNFKKRSAKEREGLYNSILSDNKTINDDNYDINIIPKDDINNVKDSNATFNSLIVVLFL